MSEFINSQGVHSSRYNQSLNGNDETYNEIPFGYAILLGAVFELVLVVAAIIILSHMPKYMPIPEQKPIMITLSAVPTPPKPIVKPKPKPTPPKPRPVVKPKPTPILHPKPKVVKQVSHKVVKPEHIRKVAPSPALKEIANPTPKPAPMVQHGPINPSLIALLTGEIRQKVKSTLIYPSAAKMMRMQGRVKVLFTYYNGSISKIKIIRPSQFSQLNNAAIKTLEIAGYPLPPKQLKNRVLQFSIWIRFKLHR